VKLAKALSVSDGETIAFVGAGGKTSAMFALAREMGKTVVLTTTTHLGGWQAALADEHIVVNKVEDLHSLSFFENKIVLVTGPRDVDGRLGGMDALSIESLKDRCENERVLMLIEADGAKLRHLKAPAEYEPSVPVWVDKVVVMAGLGGLGKPLDSETVHRPEIFSNISKRPLGSRIVVGDLVAVLRFEKGGLQGIPEKAQRILFLNQAEGPALQAKGARAARPLVEVYDAVLIGSLHQPGQTGPIFSVQTQTAGVILAAGGSSRLGRPKQMLAWEAKPFIVQGVQNALAAGLSPLIVITGADHEQIESVLEGFPVTVIHNENWQKGQSNSMRMGLGVLPEGIGSVIFLLSDQPQIPPTLIRQLIEAYSENRKPITAPMAGGQRGNPVLFARETFTAMGTVRGDKGGRAVFNRFEVHWLPWVDDRILMDVDTEEDFRRLKETYFPE